MPIPPAMPPLDLGLRFPRSAGHTYDKEFHFPSERFLAQANFKTSGESGHEEEPGARGDGANLRLPRRPDRPWNSGPPCGENTMGDARRLFTPYSRLQPQRRKKEAGLGSEQSPKRCNLDR